MKKKIQKKNCEKKNFIKKMIVKPLKEFLRELWKKDNIASLLVSIESGKSLSTVQKKNICITFFFSYTSLFPLCRKYTLKLSMT